MKQERLKVLSLLEEGKVTADEAANLLDKLNQADNRHFISEDTAEHVEENLHKFAKNVEHFAKELAHKVEHAYRDVEPKLKRASQVALEKTAAVVDDIAHSLHDSIEKTKARAEEEKNCCEDDGPKPN